MSRIERLMWDVYGHVRDNGARMYEGGASVEEALYLRNITRVTEARAVVEIGFNVGFSAIAFLESGPDVTVVSFELDRRHGVELAKDFVDERYPGRHELVIGNSVRTVPAFVDSDGRAGTFDIAFVDGGHEYEVASSDIQNACRLVRPGGIVVVDDLTPWHVWGAGPSLAWQEAIDDGLIEPLESFVDGKIVDTIVEPGDRAWAAARATGVTA
ncbi:MAG TPA: class I SAM-dependent methyltransferase [Pseudonocardiaceae bacterium]|nr:class I SAM-dependent methyltransferase [Pseudonocardiaceae bacterium]